MAAHADHNRTHTAPVAQRRIDERTFRDLQNHADGSPRNIAERLEQLDREWDTDRVLEVEAAGTGLIGVVLGALFGPRFLLLPATVAVAVFLHARTGRYPLMPLFRRLGIRTAREIARERYALKGLRGDFDPGSDVASSRPGRDAADSPEEDAGRDRAFHFPPTSRRVELRTTPEVNERIRERSDDNVERLAHASVADFDRRLKELDDEWDIERVLQANASVVSLLGIALGARADRRFLVLPSFVFGFFAQHALQGWCPPIPVFRRLGVRTRKEIERERHSLKLLRGDFDTLAETKQGNRSERVRAVLAAVDA